MPIYPITDLPDHLLDELLSQNKINVFDNDYYPQPTSFFDSIESIECDEFENSNLSGGDI